MSIACVQKLFNPCLRASFFACFLAAFCAALLACQEMWVCACWWVSARVHEACVQHVCMHVIVQCLRALCVTVLKGSSKALPLLLNVLLSLRERVDDAQVVHHSQAWPLRARQKLLPPLACTSCVVFLRARACCCVRACCLRGQAIRNERLFHVLAIVPRA